ncbi:hypothetical protein AB0K15_47360 [Amycolatopsis sp. NPDC049253]|uniref:hypothetical protein n=1 Tax=Amycolatopsis sp. NPDC049253 TaxID=3155274 RepID=UPI0034345014
MVLATLAMALPATADAATSDANEIVLPQTVLDNPGLKAAVEKALKAAEAKGATDIHIAAAPYAPVGGKPVSATPSGYPSGCGLSVLIYHIGTYIESNNLTSCDLPAEEIQMLSGIAWSRFFGWEELTQDEDGNAGQYNLTLVYDWDCAGSGVHDFQTTTNGYVEMFGEGYQASAYDEEDAVSC